MMRTFLLVWVGVFLQALFFSEAMRRDCKAGTFFNGEACENCALGTYQNNTASTSCAPCPPGTYNPYRGAQGVDVCVPCQEGTFSNVSGATSKSACRKCPSGTNAPMGSISCISCPAGKFLSLCDPDPSIGDFSYYDIGMCFHCFSCASCSGFRGECEIKRPVDLQCYNCGGSSFPDKPNSLECSSCPSGTRFNPRSSKCEACPPGTEPLGGRCSPCTRFTVSNSATPFCSVCPPGHTANARKGGTKCVPCPAGTFRGEDEFDGKNNCRACKPGENSFVTGATFCMPDNTACAPNFFRSPSGACLQCTERERLDVSRKTCVACPRDHFSKGVLSTTCERCPPNSENTDDSFSGPCVCRDGWTQDDRADRVKCVKCAPGTAGMSGFCSPCFENSVAPRAGMSECMLCPPGTRQPLQGQTKCEAFSCPKGTVRRDVRCIEPASNCPPDHDRVEDGYALFECQPKSCPRGLFLGRPFPFAASKTCMECQQNERYDAERRKCIQCRNSEVSAGGLVQTCTKCPRGEVGESGRCKCFGGKRIVNGKCRKCPAGSFTRSSGDVGCLPCPAGTTGARDRPFGCVKCPVGEFSDTAGSTVCKKCEGGTATFGVGEAGCVRAGGLSTSDE